MKEENPSESGGNEIECPKSGTCIWC